MTSLSSAPDPAIRNDARPTEAEFLVILTIIIVIIVILVVLAIVIVIGVVVVHILC